jgi:histidyl-tRNA synthetase
VRALLGAGRKDASGDFTKGAGLSDAQTEVVMGFVDANRQVEAKIEAKALGAEKSLPQWSAALRTAVKLNREAEVGTVETARLRNFHTLDHLFELVSNSLIGEEGLRELGEIIDLLESQGYGPDRIVIDPSVVRGLGYYTGPVYEAELTFDITDEDGQTRQFGSVAGGGRYDDLVKRFTGQSVPATGVSIGVDRLLAALTAKGRTGAASAGPVVVTVMDRDRMADYQRMASDLRAAGIRAEVYLGNPKNFGNQMKYADKRGAPLAIIQGADEAARGVVQIKDLVLGAEIAQSASLEEWKANPAQTEVPLTDLVATVRRMLARP